MSGNFVHRFARVRNPAGNIFFPQGDGKGEHGFRSNEPKIKGLRRHVVCGRKWDKLNMGGHRGWQVQRKIEALQRPSDVLKGDP